MDRRVKWTGILGAFLVVAVALVCLARPLADVVVGAIYKNVAEPADEELPVTVSSYLSGPQVVSIVGGGGHGLNCSLPPGVDGIFSTADAGTIHNSPVRQRFRQACVFHDLCYRHGLATYGYTQNDCDELLQEHALRICISVSPQKSVAQCQLDAKKVAFGVKFGGFKFFQGWGRSTYLEFDTNPYRSIRFNAARVIERPFVSAPAGAGAPVPDQLLMNFLVRRSGATVACLNCPKREFSAAELASAGQTALPPNVPLSMTAERAIWLPAGKMYPAPQQVTDQAGQQLFVWINRERNENSHSCMVVAKPTNLLTHTRPTTAGCSGSASERLGLGQIDLLSSSPQLAVVTGPPGAPEPAAIVSTGITTQARAGGLHVCMSKDMRNGFSSADPKRLCTELIDRGSNPVGRLDRFGAFQNFPVRKGDRHIYFARAMSDREPGGSAPGIALAFDVTHVHLKPDFDDDTGVVLTPKRFVIADDFDPMMPLSADADDWRMLSLRAPVNWLGATIGRAEIHEIDLDGPRPEPRPARIATGPNAPELVLHASWLKRPVLVLKRQDAAGRPVTQLILSRAEAVEPAQRASALPAIPRDQVKFEVLALERRPPDAGGAVQYVPTGSLSCIIIHALRSPDRGAIKPCRRTVAMTDSSRATPATQLQGAQLVVGQLREPGRFRLALMDACLPEDPVYLSLRDFGKDEPANQLDVAPPRSQSGPIERTGACQPISSPEKLAVGLSGAQARLQKFAIP